MQANILRERSSYLSSRDWCCSNLLVQLGDLFSGTSQKRGPSVSNGFAATLAVSVGGISQLDSTRNQDTRLEI